MMNESAHFLALVDELSSLSQVDALLLAGSRATGLADDDSDYDLYVYLNAPLSLASRQQILDKYCRYIELNNQFWETEDDAILHDGIEVELIYRDFEFLNQHLQQLLLHHQASVGYSTCIWANLLDSKILYDANGLAGQLQQRYKLAYPQALQQAIIDKNLPLLLEQIPAYSHQLAKALQRQDRVSLNHRCSEYLASYFDVLFALNQLPHPGEKRMLNYAESHCQRRPQQLRRNIEALLSEVGQGQACLLERLKILSQGLCQCIEEHPDLELPGI
ncbi:nucleotidyltransferase domain-containing protein [Agarivorans gilvus]|jgi:predicted nucleotidyltransferase|uniref:Nucleotidyltransferase n=1 Tax=Agarivorans gilvus TaxID=680279 RepID=A0ABQ1I2L6_9ALTE|nr:nucleotidyltransferase domain-containing protein [Agarivorans gilvus]GGB06329.1 nucleotidyltransferase [Agarivorans gilvus]